MIVIIEQIRKLFNRNGFHTEAFRKTTFNKAARRDQTDLVIRSRQVADIYIKKSRERDQRSKEELTNMGLEKVATDSLMKRNESTELTVTFSDVFKNYILL